MKEYKWTLVTGLGDTEITCNLFGKERHLTKWRLSLNTIETSADKVITNKILGTVITAGGDWEPNIEEVLPYLSHCFQQLLVGFLVHGKLTKK